jgi:hypothetical protein
MAHGSWGGARLSEPIPSSSRAEDLALAVTVARRYFVDDRTKVEIAAELKLSRFKVARLLDLARDSGLVRISIGTPGGVDVELSDQLRRRLGLTRAIVVNAVDGGDAEIRSCWRRSSPPTTCSAWAGPGPPWPPRPGCDGCRPARSCS